MFFPLWTAVSANNGTVDRSYVHFTLSCYTNQDCSGILNPKVSDSSFLTERKLSLGQGCETKKIILFLPIPPLFFNHCLIIPTMFPSSDQQVASTVQVYIFRKLFLI
uniref:Putative ovule protein n=1 Tax=Solanum chacoense TaxID=4108 RepID=A0A0V0IST3_SOLCH